MLGATAMAILPFDGFPSGIFQAVEVVSPLPFVIPSDPHIPPNPIFPANPASLAIDALFDNGVTTTAAPDDWGI
jgi:hypothetical protein